MPSRSSQPSPAARAVIDLTGHAKVPTPVDRLRRRLAEAQKAAAQARKDHKTNWQAAQETLVDYEAVKEALELIATHSEAKPNLASRLANALERLGSQTRTADEHWRGSASTLTKAKKAVAAAKKELAEALPASTPVQSPQ